jgi:hypothetical protein
MNIQNRIKEQYEIYSSELERVLLQVTAQLLSLCIPDEKHSKTRKVTACVWCVCSDVTGRDEMNRLKQ